MNYQSFMLSFTGKREAYGEHIDRLEPPSEPMAEKFRKTLRFPIYVHSKMMIVDDAYIIVGSANINQRSMAGMVFFFIKVWYFLRFLKQSFFALN